MKLRALLTVALLFAIVAAGVWIWLSRNEERMVASESERLPRDRAANTGQTTEALPAGSGTSVPTAALSPKRMISNVSPDLPLVRSTPELVKIESANRAAPIKLPNADLKTELESVQLMLRDYRTRMGENPVGSNAEIMKAVMGGNPVHASLGPPAGQTLNAEGELIDRWGTAYFFHQLAKDKMEIRSAGPDGRMWTADDLVTK